MTETYYDLLGVSRDAGVDEIERAYRERLKETHPDVSDDADASDRTRRLIEAKEVLTDEAERARYDRVGHEQYVDRDGVPNDVRDRGARRRDSAQADTGRTGRRADPRGGATTGGAGAKTNAGASAERGASTGTDAGASADSGASADGAAGANAGPWADADVGPGTNSTRTAAGAKAGANPGASATGGGSRSAQADRRQRREHVGSPSWSGHREAEEGSWRAWNPGSPYAVHRSEEGLHGSRLFPPGPSLILLFATFVTYPVLVWGAMLPPFPLVANLAIGACVLLVVAYLQSIPEVGIVVFGTWTVLGSLFLLAAGIPIVSLTAGVVFATTALPFGLSLLTRAALR